VQRRSYLRHFLLTIGGLVLCGCVSHPSKVATVATVAPGEYLLIAFTNRDVPEHRCKVNSNGEIGLPLKVTLHVAGMTLQQVEQAISRRYPICFAEPLKVSVSKVGPAAVRSRS
jgi:protein involved in polysaccharide export with SLBB domain